jgi:hypothetical protein
MDTEKITIDILDLINTNNELLEELKNTASEVDLDVVNGDISENISPKLLNLTFIADVESRARAINKRIQDNISTIGALSAMITLPADYFDNTQEELNYRAKPISTTFVDVYNPSQVINAKVKFQNAGFKSWTKIDNVYLQINIKNDLQGIGSVNQTLTFQLDDADDISMGAMKEFSISMTMPSVSALYTVTISICTPLGAFDTQQTLSVRII